MEFQCTSPGLCSIVHLGYVIFGWFPEIQNAALAKLLNSKGCSCIYNENASLLGLTWKYVSITNDQWFLYCIYARHLFLVSGI